MTRRLLYLIGIMSLSFWLSACSGQTIKELNLSKEESQGEAQGTDFLEEEALEMTEETSAAESIGQSEPHLEEITELQPYAATIQDAAKTGYAYQMLDDKKKQIYMEILGALTTLTAEQQVSTIDPDELNMVFQCVMNDHPEIFYVNGYQYKLYTLQNEVTKIIFEGVYTKDAMEIDTARTLIGQYVDNCFADMPQNASAYEKVKYLYEYIILHTEYSSESEDSQNICSVLIDRQSVCQGYAKAMQYLCNLAGIDATLVTGYANGEGHAWNLVNIENAYYYVDVTWGDASYVITGAESNEGNVPPITYDYLMVTTDMLEDTHQIDNVVDMPICASMENNYYVQENLYFSSFEEEKIQSVFEHALEAGNRYITIKCSDTVIYSEIKEQLINKQKVFTYLANASTSIAYSENQTQLTLSFWLV